MLGGKNAAVFHQMNEVEKVCKIVGRFLASFLYFDL
jgi:hypothetical protein